MQGQQLHESSIGKDAGAATVQQGLEESLVGSQYGVGVEEPAEVAAYLRAHPDLALVVADICGRAREEFGPQAQLILKVYRDPEIEDRYLTLYVRLRAYDRSITARLERVSEPFDEALCKSAGHFLVTTDFRAPTTTHGV